MVSVSKLLIAGSMLTTTALASMSYNLDPSIDRSGEPHKMSKMMAKKVKFWTENHHLVRQDFPSILNSPQECTTGSMVINGEVYTCDKIDFLSAIGISDMILPRADFPNDGIFEMSDIWGWRSDSGMEVTIACTTTNVWLIDSTDFLNPRRLGYLESPREESFWGDVKVHNNTLYYVQDRFGSSPSRPNTAMVVFDLKRLESPEVLNSDVPIKFEPDFLYAEHGATHNTVVNTETGYLYNVAADGGNDCNAGLHIIDLNQNRLEPTFAACAGTDGYVHDAQCVVYKGPDTQFFGREICFGYNEDTLTIYDVEDKNDIRILSRTGYVGSDYTHQGWLNADQDFLLLDDEGDETAGIVSRTRTFVVDVSSLEAPVFTGFYDHPADSIDHNLYFWGIIHENGWGGNPPLENPPNPDIAYAANYGSGLRVMDTTGMKQTPPDISELGFFDVSPRFEEDAFFGAWSTYMHPSGVIAVTVIESGVFFLNFTGAFEQPPVVTNTPTEAPSFAPTRFPTGSPVETTQPPVPDVTPFPTADDGGDGGDDTVELVLTAAVILLVVVALLLVAAIAGLMSKMRSR